MFEKFLLNRLIKAVAKQLPELKEAGLALIELHKDELLEKVKQSVKKVIIKFVEEKLK